VVLCRRRPLVVLVDGTCEVDLDRHLGQNLGVVRMEAVERSLLLLEGVGSHCNRLSREAVGMLRVLERTDCWVCRSIHEESKGAVPGQFQFLCKQLARAYLGSASAAVVLGTTSWTGVQVTAEREERARLDLGSCCKQMAQLGSDSTKSR